jgi:hypothetical protein
LFSQQISTSRKNYLELTDREFISPDIDIEKINRSFVKLKKSLIFVCALFDLRQSHIQEMLPEVRKEKKQNPNLDFFTLLLLDQALCKLIQEDLNWLSQFHSLLRLKETRERTKKSKQGLSEQDRALIEQKQKELRRLLNLPVHD